MTSDDRTAGASERVGRLIRPAVRAMSAYHVAPAEGMVKLDAMENPYGWPDEMVDAWLERLRSARVNRYPDAGAGPLKRALTSALGLPDDLDLVLGNGSDELIQLLTLALAGPGRSVLAPEPSFAMYRVVSSFTGSDFVAVPLAPDWTLDPQAMLAAVRQHRPELVFLAYPNNPTGNLFEAETMDAVIRETPGLVVVDEAYAPFARASYVERIRSFPNVVVLRTLSKLGLAGLRLGLLIGTPEWTEQLEKLRLPYNINTLSQLTATFALEHYRLLAEQAQRICDDRDRLYARLGRFEALEVWPSTANFLLVRARSGSGAEVARALRVEGVLVKVLDGSADALAGCLRISVGTPAENRALIEALERALDARAPPT